jgi:hypothetical protein
MIMYMTLEDLLKALTPYNYHEPSDSEDLPCCPNLMALADINKDNRISIY